LLYSVLSKHEDVIKNKKLLTNDLNEITNFINEMRNYYLGEVGNNNGAVKAYEIIASCIGNSEDYSDAFSLISGKINEINKESKKIRGFPLFSEIEGKYLGYLLNKACVEKYKITKNDFTDCIILSTCDYIKYSKNENVCLVTFDKRLKEFIQSDGKYYNADLYKSLYKGDKRALDSK